MHTKRLLAASSLALLVAGVAGCGDDPDPASADRPHTTLPLNPNAAGGGEDGGTIVFSLEDTDAVFIEGFDVGIRFTDAGGDVVQAVDWNEYVASLGGSDVDAYYDSTLEQAVPAGAVTVEAVLVTSIGGPIEPPDLEGEMPCKLTVDVPAGGQVAVEMALTNEAGCLTAPG